MQDRVQDLINKMTNEEKMSTNGIGMPGLDIEK
jgi:hypothetical protein